MRILLFPLGTIGDVYPFLGIGKALKARGHDVKVITNGVFESITRQAGLEFIGLGDSLQYRDFIEGPRFLNRLDGLKLFSKTIVPWLLGPTFDIIRHLYIPDQTAALANLGFFGVRVAQEKLGLPACTVHLAPLTIRSLYDAPSGLEIPTRLHRPKFRKRVAFRIIDLCVDRILGPPINAFRIELGLPPIQRAIGRWFESPQLVLNMFPDWYAQPQPDWPKSCSMAGFSLYDGGTEAPLPAEVANFLNDGDPPIVFGPGSPYQDWRGFYQESMKACLALNHRGILLGKHTEHLPRNLPREIRHFDYVPLSLLLPRALAVVHHGGMGTLAQSLAAGIPQLVRPLCTDQPENANRLLQLGVARTLKPRAYNQKNLIHQLDMLLSSSSVATCCRLLANKIQATDAYRQACLAIETLISNNTSH